MVQLYISKMFNLFLFINIKRQFVHIIMYILITQGSEMLFSILNYMQHILITLRFLCLWHLGDLRSRDRVVVGFTNAYAISTCHH